MRLLLLFALLIGSAAHAQQTVEYAIDDGDGDTNQGPPSTFDPQMLWGNYFLTDIPNGIVISEISAAFGPTFPSLEDGPVTFWILDDPDADFDPRNATALASIEAMPDVFGDTFFTVQTNGVVVSDAFFIGVSAALEGGADRPARVDTDAAGDRSWFFYDPDIAGVINDLGSAAFGTRMDNPKFVIFPGAFMIRATGRPFPVANEEAAAPLTFTFGTLFPNPLRSKTTLSYHLAEAARVTLNVYDVTGRQVATLVDGTRPEGQHTVPWNPIGLAPGVYLCRMQVGDAVRTQRLTVLP